MNESFPDEEKLYRAVFSQEQQPSFWKENGKISSAAFKDRQGLSVERGDFREDAEVVEDMKKRFEGNIISITVKQCRGVSAVVQHSPSSKSIYHSVIYGSTTKKCLTNSQAKHLADLSVLVK